MWDAVVIGSGIGGLAAAAALGKRGRRVLVLEQHQVVGGQTQTFRRGQWTFATGLHYIGGVGGDNGAAGQFGRLLDWLSDGTLEFAPCANPYDIVAWPGFEFGVAHPESAYRAALVERFPTQRKAIDDWFVDCALARQSAFTVFALHSLPGWLAFGLRLLRGAAAERWALRTVADELQKVTDPDLRGVLGARWGDYGAPPSRAPFVEHALVTGSYDAGAYYPVGGPGRFAATLRRAVESAGGEIRVGADVREITLRDGRAGGVVFEQGGQRVEESAAHVVSAMGAINTLACLPAAAAAPWRHALGTIAAGVGHIALYLGFEGDIAAAGASSANRWIYPSNDIGRLWSNPDTEDAPGLFVSFPSLKDSAHDGAPTAEVLAPLDGAVFARWLGQPEGARDADYLALKERASERLLAQFRHHFPALAPMLRFHEAATPLTQRRYTRTPDGAMYGLEMTGERLLNPGLRLRTPVPGLLLAGQDVLGPGIQSAFMAGLMAAASIEPALWRQLAH